MAGVALLALSGALGLGLVARDARDAAALCVAGVAQSHIHLRFAWQVLHNLTSTFVLRGRRGTISHPPSFRVAGVALMALSGALGLGSVARDAAAFCSLFLSFANNNGERPVTAPKQAWNRSETALRPLWNSFASSVTASLLYFVFSCRNDVLIFFFWFHCRSIKFSLFSR